MTYRLLGTDISPFARKVLIFAHEKGIPIEHDPIMPFGVDDAYKRMHPQGKIPVLRDGDDVVPDSSVICDYLEQKHPDPPLYPREPFANARAKWFEEFADSGLTTGVSPRFTEYVIGKLLLKRAPDEAAVAHAETEILPPLLDYLERELGEESWIVGGTFSIADIAIGSVFVNFALGDGEVDGGRWPGVAAYLERIHARPSFKEFREKAFAAVAAASG